MIEPVNREYKKKVIFIIGELKVQYHVFSAWSVNKTKCLLSAQFSKLNFDEFQLMHSGKLLNGSTKIGKITSTQPQLTLVVIKIKSSTKLEQYYNKSMQQYISACRHDKQPIMQSRYQKTVGKVGVEQKLNEGVGNDEENIMEWENQNNLQILVDIPQIFIIFKWIGIGLFIILLLVKGAPSQIAIMITIICSHYLIQLYRIHNQKNINNKNQPTSSSQVEIIPEIKEQKQERNRTLDNIKAELMLNIYKFIQIVYCFFLSFYPNWDLTLHYNTNQQRLLKWRDNINELRPGTYAPNNKFL